MYEPLIDIQVREMKTCPHKHFLENEHVPIFITDKNWNEPERVSAGGRVDKSCYFCVMEYRSAVTRNGLLIRATTHVHLEAQCCVTEASHMKPRLYESVYTEF